MRFLNDVKWMFNAISSNAFFIGAVLYFTALFGYVYLIN